MTGTELCEVVITAPDPEWAATFTHDLVESHLAACGHQTPIRSIYQWDGTIHEKAEIRIELHTQYALVDEIMQLTHDAHPYEVPCFLVQPIAFASPDYRAWVIECTTPPPSS